MIAGGRLAGRLSDKMSSELGLLLKRDRPSIFLEGLVVNISLDRTKEQELALLAAIEADSFNT